MRLFRLNFSLFAHFSNIKFSKQSLTAVRIARHQRMYVWMNLPFDHFQLRSMPNITLEMVKWCKQQNQLRSPNGVCLNRMRYIVTLCFYWWFSTKGEENTRNCSSVVLMSKNPHFSILLTSLWPIRSIYLDTSSLATCQRPLVLFIWCNNKEFNFLHCVHVSNSKL